MDEVLDKNVYQKTYRESMHVQKKYTHTNDVNDECPLDTGVIVQEQRIELSVRELDLKRKICKHGEYSRIMYDVYEIILYNNKIYIP